MVTELTPHLKNHWVERRYSSANPMIVLPPRGALGRAPVLRTPQGERRTKARFQLSLVVSNTCLARYVTHELGMDHRRRLGLPVRLDRPDAIL